MIKSISPSNFNKPNFRSQSTTSSDKKPEKTPYKFLAIHDTKSSGSHLHRKEHLKNQFNAFMATI